MYEGELLGARVEAEPGYTLVYKVKTKCWSGQMLISCVDWVADLDMVADIMADCESEPDTWDGVEAVQVPNEPYELADWLQDNFINTRRIK